MEEYTVAEVASMFGQTEEAFLHDLEEARTGQMITFMQERLIPRGAILDCEHLRARVIQSFEVQATLSEAGDIYVATCDICPFFDLGSTPELALQKLLAWFPDELDWYQRHAQELSPSLVEDWQQLQQYVRLIEEKPEEWEWKSILRKPHVQVGLRRLEEEAMRQIAAGEFEEGGFGCEE